MLYLTDKSFILYFIFLKAVGLMFMKVTIMCATVSLCRSLSVSLE